MKHSIESLTSLYHGIPAMAAKAQRDYIRNTTPEQRAEDKQQRQRRQEERRIQTCIDLGNCPVCDAKLVRGKRDKKQDYRRVFTCTSCDKIHYK